MFSHKKKPRSFYRPEQSELWLLWCSLPAAEAELLQHAPEPALWKGLLGLNDLLDVIQTLLLLKNMAQVTSACRWAVSLPSGTQTSLSAIRSIMFEL